MQKLILSTVHQSKLQLELLVAKDSVECILVSKIIQIKLLHEIERCITIESCIHFGTKDWHQLYNLTDSHQWDDITHRSIVIPEVLMQDEHFGCCWYRNYGAIIVSSGRARELEKISIKEDCVGANGCRLYGCKYYMSL